MIKLIKNEFIKEYTLKKIIITIIFFILISICSYLFYIYVPMLNDGSFGYQEQAYMNSKSNYENAKERYKEEDNTSNYIFLKLSERNFKNNEILYNDNHLDINEWQFEALFQNNDYGMTLSILDASIAGYDISKIWSDYDYANMPLDEQKALDESLTDEYNELFDIVKNGTYVEYARFIVPKQESKLESLKADTENSDDFAITDLEKTIERNKFVIKNNITSKKDYRIRELTYLDEVNMLNDYEILDEDKYYLESDLVLRYASYKEYKEAATNKKTYLNNEIKKTNYAIDNELKYSSNDYKKVSNYLIIFYFVIAIFVIVRGGSTFASEHNNGSIRLLLTQGVSRSKIFISKVINVLLDIAIHYIIFVIIFLIVGLFFYNASDLLLPNINIVDDNIVLSNYFIDLFKNIFIASLPVIFLSMLSIFLSIITWNGIVSVGINIFISMCGIILLDLIKNNHLGSIWQYTPIPYLNMTKFMYLSQPVDIDFITSTYNMNKGIIILVIWIIVFYVVSKFIFNKKDIVNQ